MNPCMQRCIFCITMDHGNLLLYMFAALHHSDCELGIRRKALKLTFWKETGLSRSVAHSNYEVLGVWGLVVFYLTLGLAIAGHVVSCGSNLQQARGRAGVSLPRVAAAAKRPPGVRGLAS